MTNQIPHLTIGYICTTSFCHESFVTGMMDLLHYNLKHGLEASYQKAVIGSQANARNQLAKMTVGEYLLMLDTDMAFSPMTALALYQTAKKTIWT